MSAWLGAFFFRYRNALFPVAFLLVFIPGPRICADPLHAAGAGLVALVLGQIVRGATIGLQYIVRGGRDRRVYADGLVTDGLYGHCRNPMYVGNLLILLGMSLASNSWSCIVLAVPLFIFIYVAIVATEERYLRSKFGVAFDEYVDTVPRWLPRPSGLRATFAAAQFHWRRMVLKEYGTPFGWLMGLAGLALWNLWRSGQLETRTEVVTTLLTAMLVTVVVWAVIRALKKSRILVAD
jgi:protein-S-isoprenylcysteine O-methyltransferase Ste14